jgi:hypothetical protein
MFKGDAPGVEADGSIGVAAWVAVFQVATDGATDVRQLAANLMMATCK